MSVTTDDVRAYVADLPRSYDDGGLVDLNHAPVEVLARDLELTDDQAQQIVTARTQLGALQHLSELTAYTSLPPALVDRIADRAVLLP